MCELGTDGEPNGCLPDGGSLKLQTQSVNLEDLEADLFFECGNDSAASTSMPRNDVEHTDIPWTGDS